MKTLLGILVFVSSLSPAMAQQIRDSIPGEMPVNERCVNETGYAVPCGGNQYLGRARMQRQVQYQQPVDPQYQPLQTVCRDEYDALNREVGFANGMLWKRVELSSSTLPNNPYYHKFEYREFVAAQTRIRAVTQKPVEILRQLSYPSDVPKSMCTGILNEAVARMYQVIQVEYGITR